MQNVRAKGSVHCSLVIHGFQCRIGFDLVTACWKMQQTEGDHCQTIPSLYIHKTIISVNSIIIYSFKRLQSQSNCLWTLVRSQEFEFPWHLKAEDQTTQMPVNSKWCAQSKQTHCVITSAVKLSFLHPIGGTVYFAMIRSQVCSQSSLHNSISHYKIKSAAACKCGRWIMRKG